MVTAANDNTILADITSNTAFCAPVQADEVPSHTFECTIGFLPMAHNDGNRNYDMFILNLDSYVPLDQ